MRIHGSMTLLLLAHTMTLALACKNLEPSNTGVDGGNAGGTADAGADAGVDAGADAGVDAGADAGVDGGTGADAGADAGVDGGTGADAGADAGVDAGADAGFDAGMAGIPCDPAIDAGANAYSLRIDQFGNVFGVRQTCASWPMFFQGDVFARRFPADAAAEPEIKINLYSPDFCGRVSLETYGPRNAAIIWPMRENGGDGNYNLYQKQFVASVDGDGGWTTTDQLTTTNTEHYYNGVGAGVGATGRLAVVGTKTVDQYSNTSNVRARVYDAGSASNETLIDSDAGPGLYDPPPRVAVDAIGNAFAIWVRQFPSRALAGRLFSAASNSWEDAGTVSINSDAGSFSLALAATGNGVVVWQQHDGIRHNIWHSRFVPNATWTTPGLVENTSLGDSTSPRVAIAPNGDAVAVWLLSEGVQTNVWANRFVVASGLWGTESRIDSPISGTSSSALVEVDSLGNAVAAWNRTDGGQTSVWINRGSADGGWADATMISAATDGYLPSLTTNGSGTAAVLWTASGTAWMRVCR